MAEWTISIVLWLLAGSFIYILLWLSYAYFISPLSLIPNAGILAPVSRLLWAFPSEHRGRITLDLPRLHEKYGPLVRIGPKELSFYSLDIYKTVNTVQSPFIKDPRVYGGFVQDAHPGLFSITDAYEHAQRRRLMGQIFNRSKMNLLEEYMTEKIAAFVLLLRQRGVQPVELARACRALEADIVASFGFGEDIGAIAAWGSGHDVNIIKENDDKAQIMALLSNLPSVTTAWYRIESILYNFTGWQTLSTTAMKDFDKWASSQLERLTSISKLPFEPHPNFISTMIRSRLPPAIALSEAKEMLGPGTDTTSLTLAHILWGLAHDISFQDSLAADLALAHWPTDMTGLEALPRLRAAVKEGIRWAGAAAAMLPRIVPKDGATLAGKFIPGGTVISSSPIWYLRDKAAFPSPEIYRPTRWLDGDAESINPLRDEYYIPFSKGSFVCIGAHFAYLELYLSLSQILKSFRLTLPDSGTSMLSREATLPERLEWVAAVPVVRLEVQFLTRL
ncbi:hypothetical protein VE01_00916 [Pseudogymnoascus verrucosus]|uniref:Cytochrome P450 monooxygenase n=1 Tax=Pseudogymnoascus verrucosus TaxID=342668 RepID=A0A2P2SW27_9PEZI|nr:uncharacterized protein VE01_00916 [Pseudogymnoascus verrucosus]OBU01046.1 hypothetical protein VE01_00916 [Pseudogymnoascus verrucosus]